MTSAQENCTSPRESWTSEFSPRCSTPISDPRILFPPEEVLGHKRVLKSQDYMDWKKRLERKKSSRRFKIRGPGNFPKSCGSLNCSMISGFVKLTLEDLETREETAARLAASQVCCEMRMPMHRRSFWIPIPHTCRRRNPVWYQMPVEQPPQPCQSHSSSGSSGGRAFSDILSDAHRHNHNLHHHDTRIIERQSANCQMHRSLPIPRQRMTMGRVCHRQRYPGSFLTYFTEPQRTPANVNVPIPEENDIPVITIS